MDKQAAKAAAVQHFAKQYGRKAQKGVEPNDRRIGKKIAKRAAGMKPEEVNHLLFDE